MIDLIKILVHPVNNYEKVFFIIIIIIIATIFLRLITYSMKHLKKNTDIDMTGPYLIRDLLQYIVYIVAALLILEIFGINIQGILVSIGIVSIIIGFAAKDIISDFMSGLFLLVDKTVKVGETISVNNFKGKVIQLGFRTTTIKTADNVIVTIPNSQLGTTPYANNTNELTTLLTLPILLSPNIDIEEFEKEAVKTCKKLDFTVKDSIMKINVNEINEMGTKIVLVVGVSDYENIERYRVIIANKIREIINNMNNKKQETNTHKIMIK
ncbi:hypothetical protein BGI41_05435 [Methanobrevibacter sp. 87.7]|uniref:mechanosensitive ion channel family protein n=1 Tax=Methanobrevibacter sp. 87.7 TaxID=387957 RepID=UPI000B50B591|nr:mechanosensitive ion channel domain-containing protein [Methanobrevibacter sp. 87.7]OWT32864.1 hypothetical protein BGI41_05435 [Methanobrevibacter sp. 87.7]